jgi:hypothetical protein
MAYYFRFTSRSGIEVDQIFAHPSVYFNNIVGVRLCRGSVCKPFEIPLLQGSQASMEHSARDERIEAEARRAIGRTAEQKRW